MLNHIILLNNLDKLNDENLNDFAEKWELFCKGFSNKNLPIFKGIGKKFKTMNLNLIPEMKLANFLLDNAFAIAFDVKDETELSNAFIFSKRL